MNQKGKGQREMISEFIESIFSVDERIRSVSLYQDQYMIAGSMRKGKVSLDPEEEAREIDIQMSRISEIARKWQTWFGILCCLVVRYEKVNLGIMPLEGGKSIVVSTEPSLDPHSIFLKIKQMDESLDLLNRLP